MYERIIDKPNKKVDSEGQAWGKKRKKKIAKCVIFYHLAIFLCDSYRIQTCNLLIRSQVLYSVELRSRPGRNPYMSYSDLPANFFSLILAFLPESFLR